VSLMAAAISTRRAFWREGDVKAGGGMQEAQESLSSLLGAAREPSLREQIEEMNSGGGCCSLTYEVPESTHAPRRACRHVGTPPSAGVPARAPPLTTARPPLSRSASSALRAA